MKQILFFWFLLSFGIGLLSCRETSGQAGDLYDESYRFTLKTLKREITIRTEPELNKVMEAILNDGTQIVHSEIRFSTENDFYWLYAKGIKDNITGTYGIVLQKNADRDNSGSSYTFIGNGKECLHSCSGSPGNACTTCDLVIHEECKRVSCTCKTGDGACNGMISIRYFE